jgi:hypothetical protein
MNREQRTLLAMAIAIRSELERRNRPNVGATKLPVDAWNSLVQITRRIQRAHDHGWHLAAASLAAEQLEEAKYLEQRINSWIEERGSRSMPTDLPQATDLYRDLVGLNEEFGEVQCDSDRTELFVTTGPITLSGISLGRFEIRLNWAPVDEYRAPFRIVALDPSPAAKNERVTHPHVEDENLCPGAGRAAIEKSLQDGRIYDFFLIVSQILQTYSPGSAFVELEDWDTVGFRCRDCDSETDEDSLRHCQECSGTLCVDCATTCDGCGYDFCSGCLGTCAGCDERVCRSCLTNCERCHSAACSNCRETETLCKNCHEREQTDASETKLPARTTSPARDTIAV